MEDPNEAAILLSSIETLAMKREAYLKRQIEFIKGGGTIDLMCCMSTPERIALGLCSGKIPDDRAHRRLHTCSAECQADRRRLERWEMSKGKCRSCGHGLTKKQREEIAASRATNARAD